MPRLLSPEEALQRVENIPDTDTTPRETVGCRVCAGTFRMIARYGEKMGLRDLSSTLRLILEEWAQEQMRKGGVGLGGFSLEQLTDELDRRGLAVVDPEQLQKRFQKQLSRAKEKLSDVMEALQSKRAIKQVLGPEKPK